MLENYVLHITKECNMQCVYCYEEDKSSVYSWEDIQELLDNIIRYNKHFCLEFLGGEPCLRIDLIQKTIEYLENKEDVFVENYVITTNGTIINDALVVLLQKYTKLNWHASIDGNQFMNCLRILKTGMNSYQSVINNFQYLKKELNEDQFSQLGAHLVTHPYNIAFFNEGINDLYEKGVRSFGIGTIESTIIIDDDYCEEFIRQHHILSDRIKQGELPGINIGVFNSLKPKSDSRHYIRDDTGKVILETYGRVKDDIKDTGKYKAPNASSSLGDLIYNIRENVYLYHNNTLRE